MRYRVLAIDYDGTLANESRVSPTTIEALEQVCATGRRLVLVTGRQLIDLLDILPEINLFEWIVAENGAVLYKPDTREEVILADPPLASFIAKLKQDKVEPVSVGRVIIATSESQKIKVLEAIQHTGLELQLIFNKNGLMILPSNINKMTGLIAALNQMKLSTHEVVGIGDAENDHAFLSVCECSVAVANAIPALKQHADIVTKLPNGKGVAEICKLLIANDLENFGDYLNRHHLLLGTRGEEDSEVTLPSYGGNILIAGPSASGKSTVVASLLERLVEHHYQFCIIDPEGDYQTMESTMVLGSAKMIPEVDELMNILDNPEQNLVVNLVDVPFADRPDFFLNFLLSLLTMRAKTGRPHWLIVDEAHHLFPTAWQASSQLIPEQLQNTLFVTVHPNQIAKIILNTIETNIAVGKNPQDTFDQFCAAIASDPPLFPVLDNLDASEIYLWRRLQNVEPIKVKVTQADMERRRHVRKYAEGELAEEQSFYFRGAEEKLNLRAQNLMIFLQLAEGIDDETWLFHLQAHDYSAWFRERIKDENLATEAEKIENTKNISAAESKSKIRVLIENKYTL